MPLFLAEWHPPVVDQRADRGATATMTAIRIHPPRKNIADSKRATPGIATR
jgi:hypothetical protein